MLSAPRVSPAPAPAGNAAEPGSGGGAAVGEGAAAAAAAAQPAGPPANAAGVTEQDIQRAFNGVTRWFSSQSPFMAVALLYLLSVHLTEITGLVIIASFLEYFAAHLKHVHGLSADEIRPMTVGSTGLLLLFWATLAFALLFPSGWRYFVFLPPSPPVTSFLGVTWIVLINSLFVRLIGLGLKFVAVALWRSDVRRRRRVLGVIENIDITYSLLASTPQWAFFFLTAADSGIGAFVRSVLAGTYLFLKGRVLLQQCAHTWEVVAALARKQLPYGHYASAQELLETGESICPICQTPWSAPVVLHCGSATPHVFCERCVEVWFGEAATCPLCRAQVQRPGTKVYEDGATDTSPQLI